MQTHIGCTCLTFLHCVFSYVSSKCLPQKMHTHIGCICLTFLHCVFLNVPSKCLNKRIQSHIGCISLTFLHDALLNVSSNPLLEQVHSHIGCSTFHHFSSGFSYLHPSNHNFRGYAPAPLPLFVSNWVKFMIDFWSPIIRIVYFPWHVFTFTN